MLVDLRLCQTASKDTGFVVAEQVVALLQNLDVLDPFIVVEDSHVRAPVHDERTFAHN